MGAELLVTHHPLIFQPVRALTDDTSVGRCLLFLAARDMAAINAHTNLDCAPGGVNDCLAGALGLEETVVLHPSGVDEAGRPWGATPGRAAGAGSRGDVSGAGEEGAGLPGAPVCLRRSAVCRVAVGGGACGGRNSGGL